jgi:predicted SprT family Zn-dependent metalloprotease
MRGGYREGSGRSKSGYHNGMYCGSTYELCWAIYAEDHGIDFVRFDTKLSNGTITYIPDFYVPSNNTIIELKGFESVDRVQAKTELAESLGYNVVVLRKDDLKDVFKYVGDKYATRKFHELYDGYKPKYELTCTCCGVRFERDRKIVKSENFCSQKCAGKHRKFEPSGNERLTREIASAIFNSNESYAKLARTYGVSKAMIGKIKTKASYGWIHTPLG